MKILLVEDEEMLNGITAKYLRAENMTVDTCFNGQQAIDYVNTSSYDVIVMDIMMPVLDGISALAQMRNEGNTTPVLLLTAKDSLQDKVTGLNTGADDYLVKPFDLEELTARIYALARRNARHAQNDIKVGPLTINVPQRTVKRDGEAITLTAKEFDLLYYLASNENIVLSRQQILDHVWEYDYESYSNLIDVYIKDLRKKIDTDENVKLIQTVRGVGYVLKQKTKEQGHDLNSMSGAFKHLWNRIPLTFKIMLWYTLFLITLLISMSIFYYNYMGTARSTEIRDRLQQQTLIMSTDIRKFKPYEDGTFYLVYTQDGLITKGYLPDGFPNQSNLSLGQVGEIEANGMTFYYYDVPINAPNYRGFLRAITSQKITDKNGDILYALLLVSLVALLISSIGGYLFIKQGLKPLRKLTHTAKVIGKNNDLSRRIELPEIAKDEVYELTTTFNRMLSGLEDSSNREKQFSSDVSHELRTPIAVIQAESEYAIKYARTPEEMQEGLTHILEQAKFMSSLVSQLLDVARLENNYEMNVAPVDVSTMLRNMIHDYTRLCAEKHIIINADIDSDLIITGHEVSLRRAVTNLIDNAIKFTKSTINITAKRNNLYLIIEVTDNGIGIEADNLSQIFNRMYQTEQSRNKKSNHGIGLGLYFVDKVVHLHHGTITAKSELGVFTTFSITLPLSEALIE